MSAPQDDYTAPTPGRVQLTLLAVEQSWVSAIPTSTTRPALWEQFKNYLGKFAHVEREALSQGWLDNGESLVNYVWLGGSFISDKDDPDNIDVTVFLNGRSMKKIRGKPGCGWVNSKAFSRKELARSNEFSGISPIRVDYYPVVSIFQLGEISPEEHDYLTKRGAWDDWWQRLRDKDCDSPTESSSASRRGYVEVIL